MAVTITTNVSGVAALRLVLTDTTTLYFTNAIDQQRLTLTLQQDGTGSRVVVSGNCPSIQQPALAANVDSTQVLTYDANNNTWVSTPPNTVASGAKVQGAYLTNTAIPWLKGLYTISSAALTLTITNPVAGPPGVGNDGEVMTFCNILGSAACKLTMATTSTLNAVSTSVIGAGAIGDFISLQALGVNVYIVGAGGAITVS